MTLRLLIFATLAAIISLCMSLNTHNAAAMEGKTMPSEQIRESVIAGSWYPGNASRLQREVQDYLSQASSVDLKGQLVALSPSYLPMLDTATLDRWLLTLTSC
jgi:hypothetical protein